MLPRMRIISWQKRGKLQFELSTEEAIQPRFISAHQASFNSLKMAAPLRLTQLIVCKNEKWKVLQQKKGIYVNPRFSEVGDKQKFD